MLRRGPKDGETRFLGACQTCLSPPSPSKFAKERKRESTCPTESRRYGYKLTCRRYYPDKYSGTDSTGSCGMTFCYSQKRYVQDKPSVLIKRSTCESTCLQLPSADQEKHSAKHFQHATLTDLWLLSLRRALSQCSPPASQSGNGAGNHGCLHG